MKRTYLAACHAGLTLICVGAAPAPGAVQNAVSREFSIYNAPAVVATINSGVSREFSLYNAPNVSTAINSGVSREFSIMNSPSALLSPNHAVSREFTAVVPPYTLDEAATALRIAAGLSKASSDNVDRLNVVTRAPSASVVDILDACAVTWYAAHPPPGY